MVKRRSAALVVPPVSRYEVLGQPIRGYPGRTEGTQMIILGIVLVVVGLLVKSLAVLVTIGIILLVIGVILAILGGMGRAVGGRRHYY